MTSRPSRAEPAHPFARLYIITPPVSDAPAFGDQLRPVLSTTGIAAVLLRLAPADERTMIDRLKTLAPVIQGAGAALLLDGDYELVARAGADGAHLTGVAALKAALPRLKPDRIAGAGALSTRHDAILAGEAGADYVMFGEPDEHGRRPSFTAIVDRVAWWVELFEVPCVGYAATLDEIGALCAAKVDFIALGGAVFSDPRGFAVAITDAAARLTQTEAVR